jgi:hypothetical protein
VVICSTTFLRLLKLLRSFSIATAKTSYTFLLYSKYAQFSVLVIVAIDKNGKICKYYRAQNYPSLRALLARGLVTKMGERNRNKVLESCALRRSRQTFFVNYGEQIKRRKHEDQKNSFGANFDGGNSSHLLRPTV